MQPQPRQKNTRKPVPAQSATGQPLQDGPIRKRGAAPPTREWRWQRPRLPPRHAFRGRKGGGGHTTIHSTQWSTMSYTHLDVSTGALNVRHRRLEVCFSVNKARCCLVVCTRSVTPCDKCEPKIKDARTRRTSTGTNGHCRLALNAFPARVNVTPASSKTSLDVPKSHDKKLPARVIVASPCATTHFFEERQQAPTQNQPQPRAARPLLQ
jgi:hypothetical protein